MNAKQIELITKLFSNIPRNLLYLIGGFIGLILPFILTKRTKILYSNYKRIAPDKNHLRLAQLEFQHIVWNYIDFFKIHNFSKKSVFSLCPYIPKKTIKITKNSKGAVMICAHLGNFDFASSYISSFSELQTVSVAESDGPGEELFNVFSNYRSEFGMKILRLEDKMTVYNLYRLLKEGGLIILLGDRDILGNGREEDFFKFKSKFPIGPEYLALKQKKAVIFGIVVRNPRKRRFYKLVEINIPLNDLFSIDVNNAINILLKRYIFILETMIRKYPEQWLVFQPPWIE